jgi:hypothetical protein
MPQTPGTNQWVVSSAIDFQTALNAVETNSTLNTIVITRDIITPAAITGFKLPKKIAHLSGKLVIQGNNSTIKSKTAQSEPLLSRSFTFAAPPANVSDLLDQIVIKDLIFDGTAAMSSKPSGNNAPLVTVEGLRIEGASNVIVDNCNFNKLDYGLILSSVQTGMVSNCIASDISITAYTTTSTNAWNVTTNFSVFSTYSRNITFNKCTSSLIENALYGFLIQKTANVVMNDCVATGSTVGTIHHVFYDAQGGLSNSIYPSGGDELINNFNIYNIVINSPVKGAADTCGDAPIGGIYLGSLIRIKAAGSLTASGSYVKIDGLHLNSGVSDSMVINASSSKGFTHLYVYNVPYLNSGAQFATDGGVILSNANCSTPPTSGTVWEFKETFDAVNIFSSTRWYNSTIPFYRLADNFSFSSRSKNYLTNFMLINNNTVSQ